jgi:hypothetical protein
MLQKPGVLDSGSGNLARQPSSDFGSFRSDSVSSPTFLSLARVSFSSTKSEEQEKLAVIQQDIQKLERQKADIDRELTEITRETTAAGVRHFLSVLQYAADWKIA